MTTAALNVERVGSRFSPALRGFAAVGAAGILVGVPAGLTTRAIMKISALAGGPVVNGVHTSNGNAVGDFTAEGTIALMIFAGVSPAIGAALLYLAVRPWLLHLGAWRGLALGGYALALTGFSVLEPGNNDFVRFGPPALNIAMFAALFIGVGIAVAPVTDRWLQVAERPSAGHLALLAPGLLLAALVTLALAAGTVAAWTAMTRGEHIGGADAAAPLLLSVVAGILAQASRAARPFLLAVLAILLAFGAWITGAAVRILIALAL